MPPHPWVVLNVHLFCTCFPNQYTRSPDPSLYNMRWWCLYHRCPQGSSKSTKISLWCLGDGQIHIFHFLHFKCFHYFKNCELYFYIVRVWALCVGVRLHVFFKILSNLAYRCHTLFEWNWLIWKTKRKAQGQRFLLLDCCYDSNGVQLELLGKQKEKNRTKYWWFCC